MTPLMSLTPSRRALVVLVVAASLVGGTVSAGAAPAKPKPACNLLTDPADMADSPSLDVRSADIATDAKQLTYVIRVTDVDATSDPKTASGRQWQLAFMVDGRRILLSVVDGPTGLYDGSGNGASVRLDPATNEVRYTLPLAKIASTYLVTITPGRTKLSNYLATTDSGLTLPEGSGSVTGLNFQSWGFPDNGTGSGVPYLAGAPSCVKVGP